MKSWQRLHRLMNGPGVDIAAMRLDVITDRRRCDNASLQAILAKRMREQLVPPDPRPALRAVACVPLRRSATNTQNTQPVIWRA